MHGQLAKVKENTKEENTRRMKIVTKKEESPKPNEDEKGEEEEAGKSVEESKPQAEGNRSRRARGKRAGLRGNSTFILEDNHSHPMQEVFR